MSLEKGLVPDTREDGPPWRGTDGVSGPKIEEWDGEEEVVEESGWGTKRRPRVTREVVGPISGGPTLTRKVQVCV